MCRTYNCIPERAIYSITNVYCCGLRDARLERPWWSNETMENIECRKVDGDDEAERALSGPFRARAASVLSPQRGPQPLLAQLNANARARYLNHLKVINSSSPNTISSTCPSFDQDDPTLTAATRLQARAVNQALSTAIWLREAILLCHFPTTPSFVRWHRLQCAWRVRQARRVWHYAFVAASTRAGRQVRAFESGPL